MKKTENIEPASGVGAGGVALHARGELDDLPQENFKKTSLNSAF